MKFFFETNDFASVSCILKILNKFPYLHIQNYMLKILFLIDEILHDI